MVGKLLTVLVAGGALAACAAHQPRIVQASADNPEVMVTQGMATQVEMPEDETVGAVVVGNKELVAVERDGEVITLSAKGDVLGETNMIIRTRDDGGKMRMYQYHVTVQKP